MKFIINESKLLSVIRGFVNSLSYDEVCEIWVDTEPGESGDIWIYVVISEDWYLYEDGPINKNKVAMVNKIKREVRVGVKKFMGIDVIVGSYVQKC
jgi:hypothetical protein